MRQPNNKFFFNSTIWIFLILIATLSFFHRLENFKQSRVHTIDEVVYFHLGLQLKNNFPTYNTIDYAHKLVAQGRTLPGYFLKPLFKYPPGFAGLISGSTTLFGENIISAVYASLFCGSLSILIIFLLGQLLFDWKVGLGAAIWLTLDPVSIICSQKIWPDSALAFFSILSIYLFCYAVKNHTNAFFILSGLSVAMATWIKYPGFLCAIGFLIWAISYDRNLLRNRSFWAGLLLPILLLIPWIFWNFTVYGSNHEFFDLRTHASPKYIERYQTTGSFLVLGGVLIAALVFLLKRILKDLNIRIATSKQNKPWITLIIGILLAVVLMPYILKGLDPNSLPSTSWSPGFFKKEPSYFYLGRLLEFSLLYTFSYLAILNIAKTQNKLSQLLPISALTILVFYIVWGNFQCRYITALIPLLNILGTWQLLNCFRAADNIPSRALSLAARFILLLLVIVSLHKTMLINNTISYTNFVCYF